ncbi:MAG TPA: acetoin utilization protein AcuC, partial [Jatrophihabitans sp.]|nr:acetoin utilization protein AcuC [Jatrophihabitans sp.]
AAVRAASNDPTFEGYGLGTTDDPVFAGMYDASALIAGGSAQAALRMWRGEVEHAVNIAGGLHHAMRGYASGFCVFNDVTLAIRTLLAEGAGKIAYVDIDVHHGDGVQAAFYDDPRVLTISLHQDPRTLFPGTGLPSEIGTGAAEGTAINVALPPGTDDAGWLRAFAAVVPGAVRAFAPDVLVTQCGCDTHHQDPLANLELTVDGQRSAIATLHTLAHEVTQGRWVAFGGGGYGVVRCVPRTWTHLLAEASGVPVPADEAIPVGWQDYVRSRGARGELPRTMGERPVAPVEPWQPGGSGWLDSAIGATRRAVYPLLGLDPDDPRD